MHEKVERGRDVERRTHGNTGLTAGMKAEFNGLVKRKDECLSNNRGADMSRSTCAQFFLSACVNLYAHRTCLSTCVFLRALYE